MMTLLAAIASATLAVAFCGPAPVPSVPEEPPPFPIGEEEGPLVEATLWVDHASVAPGQVFWVGVTFRIRPEWHLYWPGINDTGMAPSFDWELPEGWKIGRARWPAPKRHVGFGDMLDHTLEGSPTVLFPVKVPDDADTTRAVTITCDLEWLVCQVMCVAESQRVQYTFEPFDPTQSAPKRRAQDAAAIALARRELPAALATADPPIRATLAGNILTITAEGNGKLTFAPTSSGRPVDDVLASCAGGDGEPLVITFDESSTAPIVGVVTREAVGAPPRSYSLRIPEITDKERDGFAHPDHASKP